MANGTDNEQNQALDENGNPKKVVFDAAQQAKINELIAEAQGRAGKEYRDAADKAKRDAAALQAKLDAIEAEKADKSKGDKPPVVDADLKAEMERIKNAHIEEATRMRKQMEAKEKEAAAAAEALNSMKRQAAIQLAASKVNFVDPSVVVTLTKDQVKFDNELGRFVVLNENGSTRMNSSFEPTTLDEFYSDFAASHSYLVRGEVKPGTGASESNNGVSGAYGSAKVEDVFGPKSIGSVANSLMLKNPKEYHRLKVLAREKGLIG